MNSVSRKKGEIASIRTVPKAYDTTIIVLANIASFRETFRGISTSNEAAFRPRLPGFTNVA